MLNSPNPVDGDVQALTGLCKIEIKRWKAASETNPNMRYMVALMETALASLTTKPVGTVSIAMDWNTHRNIATINMRPDLVLAEMKDGDAIYTTPPAQLLRPVELPEVQRLNATAQPVSDGWVKCSERMPEPGVVVLVYTPPQPCDLPGDVRINFDWIDAESDNPKLWYLHNEQYEYFCHVATGESSFGPSEIAPYTHWMPLPAAPGGQDE